MCVVGKLILGESLRGVVCYLRQQWIGGGLESDDAENHHPLHSHYCQDDSTFSSSFSPGEATGRQRVPHDLVSECHLTKGSLVTF